MEREVFEEFRGQQELDSGREDRLDGAAKRRKGEKQRSGGTKRPTTTTFDKPRNLARPTDST